MACCARSGWLLLTPAPTVACGLSRVELDHELLVELDRHLVAPRHGGHVAAELVCVDVQPIGSLRALHGVSCVLEVVRLPARLADFDAIALLDLGGRDRHDSTVDREVAVR